MSDFNPLQLYKEHFVDKQFERLQLFLLLNALYTIKSVLYPGSFVHMTPSFVFPKTVLIRIKELQNSLLIQEFCNSFQQKKDMFIILTFLFILPIIEKVLNCQSKVLTCSYPNMPGVSQNTANNF